MRRLDPCEVGGGEVKHKMVEQTYLNRRLFKREAEMQDIIVPADRVSDPP